MSSSQRSQRVLVTGGGSGLGLAIAREFAANGAVVWIADADADVLRAALDAQPGLRGERCDTGQFFGVCGGVEWE